MENQQVFGLHDSNILLENLEVCNKCTFKYLYSLIGAMLKEKWDETQKSSRLLVMKVVVIFLGIKI